MNLQAIRILFMKDLFLSRRHMFAYFAGGVAAAAITCVPEKTISFVGFILILTLAIAAGIHLIGTLLLSETSDQTRSFVMSMPVSLLDYSVGKISVVLTTYLIPWTVMFALTVVGTFTMPWAKQGSVVVLPAIFFFLLAGFAIQLVTAVASESVGWTISVMVGCNVTLNIFLMKLFAIPEVEAMVKSDSLGWPLIILQILGVEVLIVITAIALALLFQSRKRDLI
jgi:hypothetical protein